MENEIEITEQAVNRTSTRKPSPSSHPLYLHNSRTTAAVGLPYSQPYTIPSAALAPLHPLLTPLLLALTHHEPHTADLQQWR